MTNGFTLLSLIGSGQAGVETVQKCLKYDHLVVAMKIQQRFHTHRCTMDFDFMFAMNECNDDNKEIADACVHKLYAYVCYLYRTFYLSYNYVVLVARIILYRLVRWLPNVVS